MNCRGCGNKAAYHTRSYVDRSGIQEVCNVCGDLSLADSAVPDVYLGKGGKNFANLCDDMGRPYEISSKRQKAAVMKKLGVSEAGDTVNGAPYGTKTWIEGSREHRRKQFDKERPKLREIYKEWRERRG
jgi:hypothetical protein